MSDNCRQFQTQVSEFVDGELSTSLREQMNQHRLECGDCGRLLDTLRASLRIVADERWQPVPEGMSQRLHAALVHGLGEPLAPQSLRPPQAAIPARSRRWGWNWKLGWAGAALAVLLTVGVLYRPAPAATISGWLMDRHCLTAFAGHDGDHSRDCLMRCVHEGYGVVDAKGHFTPFDAKGNKSAFAALQASHAANHLWVTVKARPVGGQLEVEQLALATTQY